MDAKLLLDQYPFEAAAEANVCYDSLEGMIAKISPEWTPEEQALVSGRIWLFIDGYNRK